MAMFGSLRDVRLMTRINRELLGNIISQQASIYKFKLNETQYNLYNEANEEKFYDGPYIFDCLINRNPEEFTYDEKGVNFTKNIDFYFLREDLKDGDVYIEVGDIILYEESYYEVDNTIDNQYILGKNPEYAYRTNPLNPGLENFGNSVSILVKTHYIPSDKVQISPNKERF